VSVVSKDSEQEDHVQPSSRRHGSTVHWRAGDHYRRTVAAAGVFRCCSGYRTRRRRHAHLFVVIRVILNMTRTARGRTAAGARR